MNSVKISLLQSISTLNPKHIESLHFMESLLCLILLQIPMANLTLPLRFCSDQLLRKEFYIDIHKNQLKAYYIQFKSLCGNLGLTYMHSTKPTPIIRNGRIHMKAPCLSVGQVHNGTSKPFIVCPTHMRIFIFRGPTIFLSFVIGPHCFWALCHLWK